MTYQAQVMQDIEAVKRDPKSCANQLKAMREALEAIANRARTARKYGPDMLSSKNLCIDDIIALATNV